LEIQSHTISQNVASHVPSSTSDGCTIQDLQRRSFDLHAELANHFGADSIDYRRLECIAVSCCDESNVKKKPSGKKLEGVEWADMNAVGCRKLGGTDTIAQVHPKKLCMAMWNFHRRVLDQS
jgi:hypothetical protein